ncbi:MAG TPA: hypothetical protein DF427_01655 [Moraxellaceae bacterium]|nr:hypothetical protein [Moraxellaceae bacterium]
MINITRSMLEFKEAVRHTWNCYFSGSDDPISPETQEAFSSIERALLRVLVLAPHGVGDLADSYRLRVLPSILVSPTYIPGEMPIRFGLRDANKNVVWDEETLIKIDDSTRFHFFDFFDWYQYGHVDLPFVRVRCIPQTGDEANESTPALIEQRYCQFMLVTS